MSTINFVILTLFIIFTFIKCLDFIYLFQIKEYRFDRFFSLLREEGLGNVLYFRYPRIPAKSARNILLVLISAFFMLIFPADLVDAAPITSIFLFLSIPIVSFFLTMIGVWLTGFLAGIQRNSIIDKAADKLKNSQVTIIGVTGSYGKSSVKEFIYHILSSKYKTAKTDENMNTDVGVALSIVKNLQPDTEYFVAEMGAYRVGEIKKICGLVHPKYGVLTAISNQHLALFGSKKNIEKAKAELLESLPKDGAAYINAKIENKEFFESKTVCRSIYYSMEQKSDIYADRIDQSANGLSANIKYKELSFTIQTRLLGSHNIENLLPAIGLGIDLGIPVETIQKGIRDLDNVDFKLSLSKGINNSTILNDAKNSNVEGFIAAIKTASSFPNKKKYILSKGIIELGNEKGESYKRIIKALNDVSATLITTDSLFKKLSNQDTIQLVHNEEDMLKHLKENLDQDSLVVVEGRFTKGFINKIII